MSCEFDKKVVQGTNRHYRLTFTSPDLVDPETNPEGRVNLTGSTVYYRWKLKQNDPNPAEISKSSGDPAEILILTQSGDTLGQADVFLVPSDTDSLPSGVNHYWDAWVELSDGTRHAAIQPAKVYLIDAITDLVSPSPSPSGGPGDGDDVAIMERTFAITHQQTDTVEVSLGRVPVGYSVVGLTAEVGDDVSAGTIDVTVKVNGSPTLTLQLDSVTNPTYDKDQDLTNVYAVDETDLLTLEVDIAAYENAGGTASELEVNVALARTAVLGAGSVTDIKTASYDAALNEIVLCDSTGGAFPVNLPPANAASEGQRIMVKAAVDPAGDAINDITVTPDGSDTIDGEATFIIDRARTGLLLYSDGNGTWMIF